MEIIKLLEYALAAILCYTLTIVSAQQSSGRDYPLKLQPELDVLDVETYLNNPRLLNLQIKCILFEGPCDVVGRWAKPRVKAGLLGECLLCTEKQKGWLDTWLEKLIKEYPELYRAGVAKYVLNSGVQLPEGELEKLQAAFAKYEKSGLAFNSTSSDVPETKSNSTSVSLS